MLRWQAANMKRLTSPHSTLTPAAVILIRIMVGAVFLSEGIQKFLYPEEVGAGRFTKIGLPSPEILGPLGGGFEVVCGALVLLGAVTRLAVLPLLGIMAVAVISTKITIFQESGFWKMAHASRNDFCMVLGSLFLLVTGAGGWSVDAWRQRRSNKPGSVH
jgi:putative oxidoreductase